MSKFYKHKPYWARPEDWVTRKPSGAKQAGPRVLETTRSPSGEWSFNGDIYTPPEKNNQGRRKGTSVPNTRPSGMDQFSRRNMMKQRMAAALNKANIAMAVADALPDIIDYGWDDFMEGRAPPPFDFLNVPIPPSWLPTKTPDESRQMPSDTVTYQDANGDYWAFPYAIQGATARVVQLQGVPNFWPPPGTTTTSTSNFSIKSSHTNYTSFPWDDVDTTMTNTLTADTFNFGSGNQPAWRKTVRRYTGRKSGIASWRTGAVQLENYYYPRTIGQPGPNIDYNPDRDTVGSGPTPEAAKTIGTPGRTVMTPLVLPARHAFKHPYENVLKEIAGIRIVDIPAPSDLNVGGTKVIGVPGGPIIRVPTKPGEPPHPPGNGTKERKRLVGGKAFFFTQKIFHGITEYQDLLDAVFDALPEDIRKAFKMKGPILKSAYLWRHLDKVDIGDAIVNIAWNQFEDYVLGTGLFGMNKKAAIARGDRYAFRTLNSANNYGGLDELGKAYGDFSKEYVNPKKDDLKRFLSERFGL